MNKITLFVYRRDLRIQDNLAFKRAIELKNPILPVFIFDPNLLHPKKYFTNQFLFDSIQDLQTQFLKNSGSLSIRFGNAIEEIQKLVNQYDIQTVIVSRDYTPISQSRDSKLYKFLKKKSISFEEIHNIVLHPPELLKTKAKTPFKIFSQYYKSSQNHPISRPSNIELKSNTIISENTSNVSLDFLMEKFTSTKISPIHGGRENGLTIINNLQKFSHYKDTRDYPANNTSRLSPYLKYGCISPRETYYKIKENLGEDHEMRRQLFWRDFYIYIGFHFPYVFTGPFNQKMKSIPWDDNLSTYEKWKAGMTGFPIVDAGMRELNETGFMHNRIRMVVASFLTKDLFLNWKLGEKYFAEKLVDHDVSVNNGSWQWSSSTGTDAVPYFRIFNPWRQQERFDPNCEYIKKWVPELQELKPKDIHNWENIQIKGVPYPSPILDHREKSNLVKAIFKEILSASEI